MLPFLAMAPPTLSLQSLSAGVRVPALNHVFQRGAENTSPVYRKTAGESVCLLSGFAVWFMLCPSDLYKCRGLGDNTVRPSASPDPRMCFLCQILKQKGAHMR